MNNTIPNVPRKLLERVLYLMDNYIGTTHTEEDELRALLSAPSPAGVDGLEVVAWVTTGFSGKSRTRRAFTVNADDAARQHTNWTPHYRQVTTDQLCHLPDAQAIIDGLRGEVERLQFSLEVAKTDELSAAVYAETESIKHSLWDAEKERDQQAQRIGELETALEFACKSLAQVTSSDGSGHADIAVSVLRMAGTKDADALHVVEAYKAGAKWRIAAAPAAPAADAGLVESLKQAFPLFDEDGLNELYHHCEIAVLGDRKRLHKLLAIHSAKGVV